MPSKYSFWLLKPHQKPVACQFEINEGTGVRLLRDAGGQLFKFTFEKIVKWNLGRDPNFLELQIQIGKTGPAGSLKFQVKDESSTEDIHTILDIITRNKGGGGGSSGADSRKQSAPQEKTNVARKKEAEEIKKSSNETIEKIKKERRQQSIRLQQANVTVTPAKQDLDSAEMQDKMIRHKKSIQAKRQERNRSFALASKESQVAAKINASMALASPNEPSASTTADPPAVRERPSRKKSSRASIYSLASSTNYEEMEEIEEEGDEVPEMKESVPKLRTSSLSKGKKVVRQPSGIMPAPRPARALSNLSAIGEAEERGVAETTPTRERPPPPPPSAAKRRSLAKAPPPPTSPSPRQSRASASTQPQSQSKPPPPPPPASSNAGQPQQQTKRMSLVQARRSMYQQREEESVTKGRSPSPSPLRRSPATSTDKTTEQDDEVKATPSQERIQETKGEVMEETEPMQTEEVKEAPSPPSAIVTAQDAPSRAPAAKRGSFMLTKVDAASQPDLAEARSMINMLKMELQKEKDKAASSDRMLKEITSEREILESKYNILANEKESCLEEIASLKRSAEKKGSIQGGSEEDISAQLSQALEEKENLSEENSNLLKSEALLLRTVMESSDTLGALSNRLWQVCEAEQPEDTQESTDDTDADMQALRKTISSFSKAMDAMEEQKVQKDEELNQIKNKLKRMQDHKHKMEQQIKEEGEVTSALMTEAETAAVEGEDMRSMMEEFKAIAEQRSEELQAIGQEKEDIMSNLASVTREYDLLKANVSEAVEQAVEAERTKSVAHLKSELSKEKQKYEQMLEELLKDEEERSKQEESQAEAIERQVAETLANNEAILKERMAELEAQYNSSSGDATKLAAKNAQLEKDLESANAKYEKMEERLKSITSEIKFLSASTSSAYRAVESFVENSITFTNNTIEHFMSKGEAFALKTHEEVEVVYNNLNEEMDRVSAEVDLSMSGGSIEMASSSSEASPVSSVKLSSGKISGSETAAAAAEVLASVGHTDATVQKKPRTTTHTTSITGMVHMDIPESLSEQFQVVQEPAPPSPSPQKKDSSPSPPVTQKTTAPVAGAQQVEVHLKEGEILLQKLDEIKELSSQRGREQDLQEQIGNMSADLQQAQTDLEALGLQLKEAREDLAASRKHAEDADNVRNVVEAQCRTLVLELAASRLNTTSQLLEEDFVGTKDTEPSGNAGDIAKGIQLSGDLASRLVVPVDILRQGMPTYTLLELTDHGMKLGETEVELSKKREDFPWNRINQITVGIAQDYVSLDMFEHANAEAVHVRIRDVRHLNTVLTVITKKRIEAALAFAPQMASVHDGIDFGLNVTKVYQDPGEVAVQAAKALLQSSGVDIPAEQMENAEGKISSMSPAVVRISSVSRGLARTHMNLKRRLLTEGLGHLEMSSKGKTKEPRFNLGVAGEIHESIPEDDEEKMMDDLKLVEEETEREKSLCSKIATLEAVRNDLVHKLASIRVSAVAAVMQAQNVVKYLATESRGEMAQELLKVEGQHDLPEEPLGNSPSKRNDVPTWKPVNEAVQNLLKESISWSANDLIDPARVGRSKDGNFSFGMNEAEREAFLVAQAEAELTQSAVNCLEGLWKDRVANLQAQLDLTQQKGDETQDHESKLLQDMASSRATIANLQDELAFAKKELNTLKHVYETQESIEGPSDMQHVPDVEKLETSSNRIMAATPLAIVARGSVPSEKKSPSMKTNGEEVDPPQPEREPNKSPEDTSSNQKIILGSFDQIQSRQQQVSNEIVDAVENLKFIDERLTELDKASTFIGDRVESYFSNLEKMEESVLRHNSKLGQIEREIQEQDLKIAQVKASVIQTQQQQEEQQQRLQQHQLEDRTDGIKKSVTFAASSPVLDTANGNQSKDSALSVPYEMYFPIVSTPEATPPPSTPKEKVSLSVKAKKLENVVQNIIEMIG